MDDSPLTAQDWQVRLFVYTFFVQHAHPPTCADVAQHFHVPLTDAQQSYRRLNRAHMFFLEPGTDTIRIANPLSAVPTAFRVSVGDTTYWANCAWDSLGIPAMLGKDATITAAIPQSGTAAIYHIRNAALVAEDAVVHFPVPVRHWYADLIDT